MSDRSSEFGCFTGDCPHNEQVECDAAIRAEYTELRNEIDALAWRLALAKSALENWRRHHEWCAVKVGPFAPCNCGLNDAILAASPSSSSTTTGPAAVFDAEREARLRFLLVEFALSKESAKTFDIEEMRCLRDDVEAMIGEIDRLRVASSSTPLSETPSEDDVLTVEKIREMDGEQFLDRFFNTIGMPNATVDDALESTIDDTIYAIKVHRDEFDTAAEKYLLEKFGASLAPLERDTERGD